MFGASKTQRLFFFEGFLISMTGIWLTGFTQVHWFMYVIPVGFLIAAVSGFCLGYFLTSKVASALGIGD